MKISLITPAPALVHTGNRTTADRWAHLLGELGHDVRVARDWNGEICDLLIALHARRSHPAIECFHRERPRTPLIVALTGTDLYEDLENSADARSSLALASRIVVLQPLAAEAVPEGAQQKVSVIYQSARRSANSPPEDKRSFQLCVLAHLRRVKDPLRAAHAARELPVSSGIQVKHAGAVLDAEFGAQVEAEQAANPRYQWLGPLSHEDALDLLARSHLLVLTSRLEGGANVVSEAIANSVPVISSLIPGSVGILGKNYPGYFPVGDTAALRRQLQRAESDPEFYGELQRRVATLQPLVSPARERETWRAMLSDLMTTVVPC